MESLLIEFEEYHGNTLCTIDLPFFSMADRESENHFRFQSEDMSMQNNIKQVKQALKQALKEVERFETK